MKFKLDAGDYEYLTGQDRYDYPFPEGSDHLKVTCSADGEVQLYLYTENGNRFPFSPNSAKEYRLVGFTGLLVVTNKKTQLAIRVATSTASDRDPVKDYNPVKVGPPPEITEKMLMRQALREELGLDMFDDEFDPVEEMDLEFFDDDEIPPSALQQETAIEEHMQRLQKEKGNSPQNDPEMEIEENPQPEAVENEPQTTD